MLATRFFVFLWFKSRDSVLGIFLILLFCKFPSFYCFLLFFSSLFLKFLSVKCWPLFQLGYITNHLKMKQLKIIAFTLLTNLWLGQSLVKIASSLFYLVCLMSLEVLLQRWLSHRAGKLVGVVDGGPGTFPHGTLHRAAWISSDMVVGSRVML